MTTTTRTRNDSYRDLFEHSADAILIIKGDTFVECNQATVSMLGCESREQVLETHPSALSPEFQPDGQLSFEKANEMIAIAFAQGSHRFEWDHIRANGEVFPVEVLLTVVHDDVTPTLHTVWRDITSRKQLENELRQSQKMEAIGKLAGGMAHDFNNLLVPILGNAELLEMDLEPDSPLLEHVEEIRIAGLRAAELVRQLLAYSRKQVFRSTVLDLNRVVEDFEPMLRRLIGEDILVDIALADHPIKVDMDETQLQQVVMNLSTNARDAMPDGGLLRLETDIEIIEPGDASGIEPGRYARLTVSDTGEGVDPDLADTIFDPFVTSKSIGTGLGLSTVHGIVRQSRGDVRAGQTREGGAVFTVRVPVSDAPLDLPPLPCPVHQGQNRGNETILVVEDESGVARITEKILTHAGYDVRVAVSGVEALAMMEQDPDAVDLLLTDVIMPGMSGPKLAAELLQRRPDIKILFVSGYTNESLTSRGVLEDGVELLQKPFSSSELKQQVRSVLDKTPAS